MVAGHAVYTAANREPHKLNSEDSWFLEPFQHGQLETMLEHIKRGVELAGQDNSSLLVFSGGQTRAAAGPRSEGLSYWEAADAQSWFGLPYVRARSHTEEQARDSFENLLFSVCRFHEITGNYPQSITVVSFAFKQWRFSHLHRAAIRFPAQKFHFVGIDPPGLSTDVLVGEKSHSAKPFKHDPYGCQEEELRLKRQSRNPFRRSISYPLGCPELEPIISHCLAEAYTGSLPWLDYAK